MEFTPTEVILKRAKAAASCPALRDTEAKNRALAAMAQALRTEAPAILAENAADLEAARGKVSDVMLDRLALNEARLRTHRIHGRRDPGRGCPSRPHGQNSG